MLREDCLREIGSVHFLQNLVVVKYFGNRNQAGSLGGKVCAFQSASHLAFVGFFSVELVLENCGGGRGGQWVVRV